MRKDWNQPLEKSDLCGAEANVDLGVGNLIALCRCSGTDLGVTVAKVHDTNASGHI
jgi:hypothetical protein